MENRPIGRRELKKQTDYEKILRAAGQLFESKTYEEVTTAELATLAGVSTGTLFRRIGSKADLLIEVMIRAMDKPTGKRERATDVDSAVRAILAIINPFLSLALKHPNNVLALQREVIYGTSPKATSFIADIQSFRTQIEEVIEELRVSGRSDISAENVDGLAHAVYSSLYMDFLQVASGRHEMSELPQRMEASIRFLLEK